MSPTYNYILESQDLTKNFQRLEQSTTDEKTNYPHSRHRNNNISLFAINGFWHSVFTILNLWPLIVIMKEIT